MRTARTHIVRPRPMVLTGLVGLMALVGCASEGSERVQSELMRLEQQTLDGIVIVEHALTDPTYQNLGEGVRIVEGAVRELQSLEADPAATDVQRLQALLSEVHAWDALATAFESAAAEVEGAHPSGALSEKGMPAREAASLVFERAWAFACEHGLTDHPAFVDQQSCPE